MKPHGGGFHAPIPNVSDATLGKTVQVHRLERSSRYHGHRYHQASVMLTSDGFRASKKERQVSVLSHHQEIFVLKLAAAFMMSIPHLHLTQGFVLCRYAIAQSNRCSLYVQTSHIVRRANQEKESSVNHMPTFEETRFRL